MAERPIAGGRAGQRTLAAALAAALTAGALLAPAVRAADAADEPERPPWYKIEVVIFLDERSSAEALAESDLAAAPLLSPEAALLRPPDGAVRPRTVAELEILWDEDVAHQPVSMRVPPGYDVERLPDFGWLERLRAARDPTPPAVLDELASLRWRPGTAEPGTAEDVAAGATDSRADEATTAPPRTDAVPAPDIEPTATVVTPEDRETTRRIPPGFAWRQLPSNERELEPVARRLDRSGGYRVLAHLAWLQPVDFGEPALPLRVSWPEDVTPGLVGAVGVRRSRFLHVETDLYWRLAPTSPAESADAGWLHVDQDRRMRSGETHYLDHPRLGVIVRARPFEAEELPDRL